MGCLVCYLQSLPFQASERQPIRAHSKWVSCHPRSTKIQMCKAVPSTVLPRTTRGKSLSPLPSWAPLPFTWQILHLPALQWFPHPLASFVRLLHPWKVPLGLDPINDQSPARLSPRPPGDSDWSSPSQCKPLTLLNITGTELDTQGT